jgi:pimeloyl-ACP methyl ester carboxylesterase
MSGSVQGTRAGAAVRVIAAAHRGGSGPPLVLLHGLTASWRIWQPVIPALERHHSVFAPALAGHHGGPALEPAHGGVPAICDALERTLDEAGIGTAHLVGNSLGGWVAIELARRGRAQSVVAFSPVGRWRTARNMRRLARTFRLYDGRIERHRERLVHAMRRPGLRRLLLRSAMEHAERMPVELAVGMVDDMIATTVLSGMAGWMERAASYEPELPPELHIRIAWGDRDRTLRFTDYGAPWLEQLPQAEHVELPGCGHVPMYDDPQLVAATILEVTSPAEET